MSWSCRQTRRALPRLFAGDLDLGARLALEQHAQGCPRCGRELAREEELVQALRATSEPPTERLDVERNLAAIHARLDALDRDEVAPGPGPHVPAGPGPRPLDRRRPWLPLLAGLRLTSRLG